MAVVRPPIFPPTAPAPQRADPARLAAQKAFFQAALGQAAAAPAAALTATPPRAPATLQRIPDPTAEKPARILRPGSLLDIKV